MVLGVTFLAVCLLYICALAIGWRLAKGEGLDVAQLMRNRQSFVDPLTRRFQQWGQREKMDAIRKRQWLRLSLLIFANNFVAVALVGRTLYGVLLVPAAYLTYRQGLKQGALFRQPLLRPRGVMLPLAVLEFGSYLFATALGVNLVVTPMVGGRVTDALESLAVFYPVIAAALMLGAWLETRALRSRMPAGVQIPEDLTMEEVRAKALEMIKRQSGGAA